MSDQPQTLGDPSSVEPGNPAEDAGPMKAPGSPLPIPGDQPGAGPAILEGEIGGRSTSSDLPPDAVQPNPQGPPSATPGPTGPEGSDVVAPGAPAAPDELPVPDVVEPPVDGTLSVSDVPEGQTVTGTNPTDGKPTIVDPAYRDSGDAGTNQRRLIEGAVAADTHLTDAERLTGEVTVSSRGTADMGRVSAEHIGMGTGVEYRRRDTYRIMRVDHPFTVDGEDGESGDYLVEDPEGNRHKVTAAELNEHFVAV